MNKLFMVYVEDRGKPHVIFVDKNQAMNEAERLCRKEGRRVFLFETTAFCDYEEKPIVWNNITATP